ncbi:DUF47 domain-containing protein [Capnocytophaga sp. ARDL2]|uniref:DUF47 domain-containing protein n=1 Tax=Capnocytophaga sp. ARDL2 TaxID=3238809 RepID=UPI003555E9B3
MSLNSIFHLLVPKDKVFYPLFQQAAHKLIELSETLDQAVNLPQDEREAFLKEVEVLKSEIETIAQTMRMELSRNFITPMDREDIYALISTVNEVADYLSTAASRMRTYQIDKVTKPLRKLTEANLEACKEVSEAILLLNTMKHIEKISEKTKIIYRLERKADKVYDKAIADIFENETNAIEIIKYKEVMDALETATDSCRKVANVLDEITVKYA